jgi:hypothetical protein
MREEKKELAPGHFVFRPTLLRIPTRRTSNTGRHLKVKSASIDGQKEKSQITRAIASS